MADDLDKLHKRDRAARDAKMYNSDSSKKERERRVGPKPGSAAGARAIRHRDEITEQESRHRSESEATRRKYEAIRNKKLQTSESLPANLDRDEAAEFKALHEKHARERKATKDRHLRERLA